MSRLLLDAEGHIVRSENDMLVIDQEIAESVVLTYDAFRRFEVVTTTDIQLPAAGER